MKRIALALVLGGFVLGGLAACEPKECKDFKEAVCKACGNGSPACSAVNKRWGRDEKKCKQGVSHLASRTASDEGRKLLCTVLNDDVKKQP